jgi:hypothetical protein
MQISGAHVYAFLANAHNGGQILNGKGEFEVKPGKWLQHAYPTCFSASGKEPDLRAATIALACCRVKLPAI